MYTLLIIIIYVAFISLGLPDSLLGSSWPIMHLDIGMPLSSMGLISMLISGGTIVSSLLSDRVTRKFGTRTVTTFSVFLTALALLGFSFSKNIITIVIFAIPYGLGAGAIDAALNNYVAMHYSSKHMSWLHCFWGVGTIISPFVMSYSLTYLSWNDGYRIISFIQFGITIILLLTLPVWKVNEKNKVKDEAQIQPKSVGIFEALKIKGVPNLLLGFFCYCAAEGTAMAWSCTYLVEAKNIDEPTAAAFASCFFIGMTVGRFLAGFIMDRFGDRKMIFVGTVIAIVGVSMLLLPMPIMSYIGLVVLGLGCAPIYPCIIHSTPTNFGAENSGAIIGIQMASAYTGSTFFPPLFGVIAKHTSFDLFPIYILIFVVVMIIMVEKTFKISERK